VVTELRIYFEGDSALRPGFRQFLKSAASEKATFVATGATPVEDFRIAVQKHPNALNILLLDSEGPADGEEATRRLAAIPAKAHDCVFWMVQLMESWFLADPDALAQYYRQGFVSGLFKPWSDVESIPKADVETILHDATRKTQKGKYHKTAHAPHLLALISPDRVRQKSPHCRRLFERIPAMLPQP
jgi:hypothetical protein